jgi:hypothetical protein
MVCGAGFTVHENAHLPLGVASTPRLYPMHRAPLYDTMNINDHIKTIKNQ